MRLSGIRSIIVFADRTATVDENLLHAVAAHNAVAWVDLIRLHHVHIADSAFKLFHTTAHLLVNHWLERLDGQSLDVVWVGE